MGRGEPRAHGSGVHDIFSRGRNAAGKYERKKDEAHCRCTIRSENLLPESPFLSYDPCWIIMRSWFRFVKLYTKIGKNWRYIKVKSA